MGVIFPVPRAPLDHLGLELKGELSLLRPALSWEGPSLCLQVLTPTVYKCVT